MLTIILPGSLAVRIQLQFKKVVVCKVREERMDPSPSTMIRAPHVRL
jgi:chorismate-pyruvate lyase